ncbi:hypothetical protein LNKW23_00040 [Paralimibaculum aggregatum]|uniref:Peroxidase n=1 Tax=Paralimibaculum aggregatum TaxID=3036245 RepID=A0ABQ6LBJ9_9RHOB|nr:peroxidase family protein [Limibaculum sp. NKW23]GMG80792.1 hypothetical protein LNKW23_00040 [Limibaculum sp. NKW23]
MNDGSLGSEAVVTLRSQQDVVVEALRRLTAPAYGDGISAPTENPVPAIEVAEAVFTQGDADIPHPDGLSALWIFWGQFLDHDMDLTPEQEGEDAEFIKFEGEGAPFNVVRSEEYTGPGHDFVREQPNVITPLIDASNVYGSDSFRTLLLRAFEGGRMQSRPGPDGVDLLPDERELFIPFLDDIAADYAPSGEGFAAGDIRVQENPGLTSVHTLWLNEHNYWADRLAAEHPDWTDDELFASARAIVEVLIQQITYEEFLPHLIGADALGAYDGFDPDVDPQVSTEFSTAAYRFGHTAIPETFRFLDEGGLAASAEMALFEAFETDAVLLERGTSDLLRGVLETPAQAIDTKVVDSLNFLLFTPDGGLTGFSLPERNMLRGRDHGIDGYLSVRAQILGDVDAEALAGSTDFSVITADPAVQAELASVYPTLGDVDLWVGGLAEDKAPGAGIGPTVQAILAEQFAASRDGDPAFYLAREWANPALESEVRATLLSDVLARSGGVAHVQRDAFLASDRLGGTDGDDLIKGTEGADLLIGFAGADYLKGKDGADDLFGDEGADMVRGGTGSDGLSGGAGADKLMGEDGDDRIAGGPGHDLLVGGEGADIFVFDAADDGMDMVMGFDGAEDGIELRGFGAGTAVVEITHDAAMSTLSVDGVAVVQIWGAGHWSLDEAEITLIG